MFYSISAEKGDGGWGREEPTVWWRSDKRDTDWGKYCTEYPPHACRVRTVVASWTLEGSSYAQPSYPSILSLCSGTGKTLVGDCAGPGLAALTGRQPRWGANLGLTG